MPTRDWAAIRRNLIAIYNPTVAAKFGASPSQDEQQTINLMQIQSNDSALIAQSRIALFNQKTATPTSDSTDLVDVTVQVFDHCDENNQPVFNYQTIKVPNGTESLGYLQFQRLAAIEAQQCSQQCYAAVPEWWQVRIEGTRPQLIFLFAEVLSGNNYGSPKYPISIPHPIDQTYTQSPIPAYQKGQYEGILTLKDNSKVIVNAISAEEAQKVIDAAKQIIIPDFLQGATQKVGNRSGAELLTINVTPKRAEYFPDGLKNTKPTKTYQFR